MKKLIRFALGIALGSVACATATPAFAEEKKESQGLIAVGEMAPDFTLSAGLGDKISLSSFRGKKSVVLYFYPKDNTPGCTREAQAFRDDYESFKKAGAEILGVSVDDEKSHKSFSEKQSLNFPLLADVGGKVSRQYGVMGWFMAKRVTYVIGRDGLVKKVFPDVSVGGHSKEVLSVVQLLRDENDSVKKH